MAVRLQHRVELAQARQAGLHNIGEAAAASGVSARMIRHYERIGLVQPPARTDGNYRLYSSSDVDRLRFIRRARSLGFAMEQIASLLQLQDDPARASGDVKRLARAHADALAAKIQDLQVMQAALDAIASRCQGGTGSDCPILEDLARG